jgi:hypothetical protein
MGTKTEDLTGVHIGTTGWLFLSGGQHNIFDYFTGGKNPRPESAGNFVRNLKQRSEFCQRTGRPFKTVIFPEKCVALSKELASVGEFRSLYDRWYHDDVSKAGQSDSICYPLEPLQDNEAAFFRTDTHYAAPGCILVTEAILRDVFSDVLADGIKMLEENLKEKPGFSGDLGRKFEPPHYETARVLKKEQLVPFQMATNGIKVGNDGICILVSSPQALTDKTLLIFGDSFFRQLLPLLAVFYRRVVFCRSRFFHYEIADAFAPDHIFCGLTERYLSGCLPDARRPHFLSYPIILGRSMSPDEGFSELWNEFCDQKKLIRPPTL